MFFSLSMLTHPLVVYDYAFMYHLTMYGNASVSWLLSLVSMVIVFEVLCVQNEG